MCVPYIFSPERLEYSSGVCSRAINIIETNKIILIYAPKFNEFFIVLIGILP